MYIPHWGHNKDLCARYLGVSYITKWPPDQHISTAPDEDGDIARRQEVAHLALPYGASYRSALKIWRWGWKLPTWHRFVLNYGEHETWVFCFTFFSFFWIEIPTSSVLPQFGTLNPTEGASKASGMWDNIAGEATGAVCAQGSHISKASLHVVSLNVLEISDGKRQKEAGKWLSSHLKPVSSLFLFGFQA